MRTLRYRQDVLTAGFLKRATVKNVIYGFDGEPGGL